MYDASYIFTVGGGVITLNCVVLDVRGVLSSDGASSNSPLGGGGAGGSISITSGTLSGSSTGIISANGGSALPSPATVEYSGGGGGGRISLSLLNPNLFDGVINAIGGTGFQNGGAGTIYILDRTGGGSSITLNNADATGGQTFLTEELSIDSLTLSNGTTLLVSCPLAVDNIIGDQSSTLQLTNGSILSPKSGSSGSVSTFAPLNLRLMMLGGQLNHSSLDIGAQSVLELTELGTSTSANTLGIYAFQTILVRPFGLVQFSYHDILAASASDIRITLFCESLWIQSNGSLQSDGGGYAGSSYSTAGIVNATLYYGTGMGSYEAIGGSGGSHIGVGGSSPFTTAAATYGSGTVPIDFGSGGGGSFDGIQGGSGGGGTIHFNVYCLYLALAYFKNLCTSLVILINCSSIQVDGVLSVNGLSGNSSGAGGGIYSLLHLHFSKDPQRYK